jgi:hypothetical protein
VEDELRALGRRYQRRRAAVEADQRLLHQKVREARAAGLPLRRIAELSGLSFGRIHQLTKETDANDDADAGDHG